MKFTYLNKFYTRFAHTLDCCCAVKKLIFLVLVQFLISLCCLSLLFAWPVGCWDRGKGGVGGYTVRYIPICMNTNRPSKGHGELD